MIQITPHMKIFVAYESPDFRNGIDGLAAVCSEKLKEDPFSGALFVFRNRKGTTIKALLYDGQGFWMMVKRLSEGRFRWWPKSNHEHSVAHQLLAAHELQLLLWNGDPTSASVAAMWRPLSTPQSAVA
jgi:transposase